MIDWNQPAETDETPPSTKITCNGWPECKHALHPMDPAHWLHHEEICGGGRDNTHTTLQETINMLDEMTQDLDMWKLKCEDMAARTGNASMDRIIATSERLGDTRMTPEAAFAPSDSHIIHQFAWNSDGSPVDDVSNDICEWDALEFDRDSYKSELQKTINLLDEMTLERDRLRDLFKVEKDVHRQHTRGLNKRLDMERDTIIDVAAGFRAERDEARGAVRRLAGVSRRWVDEDDDTDWDALEDGAKEALADPVVKRIVEGG